MKMGKEIVSGRRMAAVLTALCAACALGASAEKPPANLYQAFLATNAATRRAWMDDVDMRKRMAKPGTPPVGAPEFGVPQWYVAHGVNNLRDVGGWTGLDGRRLRKGLLLRSAHLQGIKDPTAFRVRFEVKTDLDLRAPKETDKLKGKSPLGGNVALVTRSAPAYGAFGKEPGMKYFKDLFPIFLDRANYPIIFHCAMGADRTGSIAFLLQGLLGVCEHDQAIDWELTAFFNPNPKFRDPDRYDKLVALIEAQPGGTWTEKFVSYAHACGITDAEIAQFRAIMLEEK